MADSIIIADTITITDAMSGGDVWQLLKQALDISAYDTLELQFGLLGHKGSAPAGVTLRLYTSMLPLSDDTSAWVQVASVAITGASGTPEWTFKSISSTGAAPLLRHLRWRATIDTQTTSAATFSILGLARPR